MPIVVYAVGVLMSTEALSWGVSINMIVVVTGVLIASHGGLLQVLQISALAVPLAGSFWTTAFCNIYVHAVRGILQYLCACCERNSAISMCML